MINAFLVFNGQGQPRLTKFYTQLRHVVGRAGANDVPSLVTYRNYATLYFIVISTSTESPLALIDLIQVYVEALDRLF
ncbi:hypothetical protein NEMBOFW57_004560 [Staphylotrichum longicolle]|uniref:AP complex mu/sigma subunit domain-containing protein n=1 Tax=Staphylotrichum longicolle TaxID=669026 RepID=A0AAD4F7M7_9PEZI|nr:hypothetical protein NEMBOFW57_004560 [Staphylotrichum longicolle]